MWYSIGLLLLYIIIMKVISAFYNRLCIITENTYIHISGSDLKINTVLIEKGISFHTITLICEHIINSDKKLLYVILDKGLKIKAKSVSQDIETYMQIENIKYIQDPISSVVTITLNDDIF